MSAINVQDLPSKVEKVAVDPATGKKPDHWRDTSGVGFVNPWASWREVAGFTNVFKVRPF